MSIPRRLGLVPLLIACALPSSADAQPRGLGGPAKGLGQPGGLGAGGGLLKVDPKASALENALLQQVNDLRKKKKLPPMAMSARLRTLMRKESAMAAKGDPAAAKIHERIKTQGMAPYGYMVSAVYGTDAAELFKGLKKDKKIVEAMLKEYVSAGIGALWVPDEPPYYQVTVLFAQEPDPMAGKSGLTKAQTDPVMRAATPRFKGCYDQALKRNPNIGGSMLVKIVIGAGGKVSQSVVLQSLKDVDLDVCLTTVARGLTFPAPYKGKPVTLNHPFAFAPPQGGRRLGKLSDGQLNGVFSRARSSFRRCYDDRLVKKPKIGGEIILALTVLPSGDTKNVRLSEDEIGDLPLAKCILSLAQELRFPRPKFNGEVDVTYPLSFAPPKNEQRGRR